MEMSCASLIEVEVLRILRYCKISGTVISLSALKNLKPATGARRYVKMKKTESKTKIEKIGF